MTGMAAASPMDFIIASILSRPRGTGIWAGESINGLGREFPSLSTGLIVKL